MDPEQVSCWADILQSPLCSIGPYINLQKHRVQSESKEPFVHLLLVEFSFGHQHQSLSLCSIKLLSSLLIARER
ncbi:hypothetical protein ACET3Z_016911 [Daucus carota]